MVSLQLTTYIYRRRKKTLRQQIENIDGNQALKDFLEKKREAWIPYSSQLKDAKITDHYPPSQIYHGNPKNLHELFEKNDHPYHTEFRKAIKQCLINFVTNAGIPKEGGEGFDL